jgi:two-component system chemotaxis response regulator CheB
MKQVKVLVVDDSAFMRKAISMMLESDPDIKVIGTASNGEEGVELVKKMKPDVVTLDIEMPRMDGLTALKHIMKESPTPVMMISSSTTDGASSTLEALALGAVDFIPKQSSYVALDIVKIKAELLHKIKHIAHNKKSLSRSYSLSDTRRPGRKDGEPDLTPLPPCHMKTGRTGIIAIGCSTGGPPALQAIIPRLPRNLPVPMTIVQHMPPTFTKSLAERLNNLSGLTVKEAENGEELKPGTVYIAPGDKHMTVRHVVSAGRVVLSDEPADTVHRPAVDVLVKSVALGYGSRALGVILTGMGHDGLEGMRLVKQKGGIVFAQDEETSVVYGMPRAIIENELADKIVPLDKMAEAIVGCF